MMTFSEFFQRRRDELHLSLSEFADRLSFRGYVVTKSTVGAWNTGTRKPQLDRKEIREAIASALEVDVNRMMELLGFYEPVEELEGDTRELISMFNRMSPNAKKITTTVVKGIYESDIKDK